MIKISGPYHLSSSGLKCCLIFSKWRSFKVPPQGLWMMQDFWGDVVNLRTTRELRNFGMFLGSLLCIWPNSVFSWAWFRFYVAHWICFGLLLVFALCMFCFKTLPWEHSIVCLVWNLIHTSEIWCRFIEKRQSVSVVSRHLACRDGFKF